MKQTFNFAVLKHGNKKIYTSSLPDMTAFGKAFACHKVHTFVTLEQLENDNRSAEEWVLEVEKTCKQVVEEWNRLFYDKLKCKDKDVAVSEKMKTQAVALFFRKEPRKFDCENLEKIVVVQSTRHVFCNDLKTVIDLQNADTEYFESKGFSIVRQQIKVLPANIPGMPKNAKEASKYPFLYFECHIKVQLNECADRIRVTVEEVARLVQVSKRFTQQFGIPIALSQKTATTKRKPLQRYLSVRFQGLGIIEMRNRVKQIRHAVVKEGTFRHIKDIFQAVWADSNRAMDCGWIDGFEAS